jgi:hypothetical protein
MLVYGLTSQIHCMASAQARLGICRLPLSHPRCAPVLQLRPLQLRELQHCHRSGRLIAFAGRQPQPETDQRAPQRVSSSGRRLLRFGGGRSKADASTQDQGRAENNIAPLPRGRRYPRHDPCHEHSSRDL